VAKFPENLRVEILNDLTSQFDEAVHCQCLFDKHGKQLFICEVHVAAFMAGYEWAALSKGTPEQGLAEFLKEDPNNG